jgi:Ubiquitin-protein ligase
MVNGTLTQLLRDSEAKLWMINRCSLYRSRSNNRLRMPQEVLQIRRRRSQLPSCGYSEVGIFRLLRHLPHSVGLRKDKLTNNFLYLPDLQELSLGSTMKLSFPNPDDILNFTLTIEPDEGMYKGGSFHFNFAINQNFPHDPPKVKCTQKIYHPNIDLEGNVCLNILREDWKPVLNLNAVIVGLQVSLPS